MLTSMLGGSKEHSTAHRSPPSQLQAGKHPPLYSAYSSLARQDSRRGRATAELAGKQGAAAGPPKPCRPVVRGGRQRRAAAVFPSRPSALRALQRCSHMPAPSLHTQLSAPPTRPRHGLDGRKPSPAWEARATAPLHPAGSPHWGKGTQPPQPLCSGQMEGHEAAAHWGGPVGEEDACFHRSGLPLRPRCPLQPFDFLWGDGTECLQPRAAISPSAAHRYTAHNHHGFSFTGTMHGTRLFIRSAMR